MAGIRDYLGGEPHNCAECEQTDSCPLKPILDFDDSHAGVITSSWEANKDRLADLASAISKAIILGKAGMAGLALALGLNIAAVLRDVSLLSFAYGVMASTTQPATIYPNPDAMLRAAIAAGWMNPQDIDKAIEKSYNSGFADCKEYYEQERK